MGSSYLINPLMLVINTLFDLYIILVVLRFMFQSFRADFYNPVSQFVVKATTPPLKPIRRIVPSIAGQDTASLLLAFMLIALKLFLLMALGQEVTSIAGAMAPIAQVSAFGFILIALAELIAAFLNIFLFAIIILVILSWVSPGTYNPVSQLIQTIANPVLMPVKRIIPNMGGLDLSPIFATLGLMVAKMLIIPPIIYLATL